MAGAGRIVDASEYANLRRRVRGFSADLDKELKRGLKEAGNLGVDAVKQKIGMIPVGGGTQANRSRSGNLRRTSLRATLRSNVRTQVRAKDVRIVQGARGIPGANARGLPRRLNQDGPFRHPVFGRGSVTQRSWRHFDSVILPKKPQMEAKVEEALGRALDSLPGA